VFLHSYLDALVLESGLAILFIYSQFISIVLDLKHQELLCQSVRVLVSGLIFHGVIGVVMKFIASAGTMVWISIIGE